jgi:hypothetical protein
MNLFRANGKMGRGRELFHYWLKENLRSDRPYDEWVRAIIASAGKSSNVLAASNVIAREHVQGKAQPDDGHDMGMVHQLDTHDELTILYGKAFLGINLSCISCHDGVNHLEPVNVYLTGKSRNDFHRQSAFLGKTRYLMYWEDGNVRASEFLIDDLAPGYDTSGASMLRIARFGGEASPKFVLTDEAPRAGERPRDALARILTAHPQFAKATVNLFWSRFMTVGIVDPPFAWDLDRQDPRNPPPAPWTIQPSHPELLEALAKDFQKHGFDLRHLMKVITQSSAYQLSSHVEGDWKPDYDRYFARKLTRRLSAEEIYDAISKASDVFPEVSVAGTDKKVNYIMETYGPSDKLEPGTENFLDFFGRSDRKSDPKTTPSVIQASLMLNSEVVKKKVLASTEGSRVSTLLSQTPPLSNEQLVEELFLSTLSRFPTSEEAAKSVGYLERYRDSGAEDIQWTLMNKLEFIVNY